jgi:hypothetical protein
VRDPAASLLNGSSLHPDRKKVCGFKKVGAINGHLFNPHYLYVSVSRKRNQGILFPEFIAPVYFMRFYFLQFH